MTCRRVLLSLVLFYLTSTLALDIVHISSGGTNDAEWYVANRRRRNLRWTGGGAGGRLKSSKSSNDQRFQARKSKSSGSDYYYIGQPNNYITSSQISYHPPNQHAGTRLSTSSRSKSKSKSKSKAKSKSAKLSEKHSKSSHYERGYGTASLRERHARRRSFSSAPDDEAVNTGSVAPRGSSTAASVAPREAPSGTETDPFDPSAIIRNVDNILQVSLDDVSGSVFASMLDSSSVATQGANPVSITQQTLLDSTSALTSGPLSIEHLCPQASNDSFDLCLLVEGTTTPEQLEILFSVKQFYERIITEDLPSVSMIEYPYRLDPSYNCNGRDLPEIIDDVVICIKFSQALSGGNVGLGGPRYWRWSDDDDVKDSNGENQQQGQTHASGIPFFGNVYIDASFLETSTVEELTGVFIHEFGHVLGLGSILWDVNETCDYFGPTALAQFQALSGCTTFPTECDHWSSDCMGNEVMTPSYKTFEPTLLSSISLAALQDIGYTVDFSQAAPFSYNDLGSKCQCNGPSSI